MKDFSLGEWLRYGFAGAIALLTALLRYPEASTFLTSKTALLQSLLVIGLVLLIGSLIYVIHRAILYPIFYRIGSVIFFYKKSELRKRLLIPWWVDQKQADLDIERWKRLNNETSIQKYLSEWASQIHYLYSVTWAIILGIIFGSFVGWEVDENSQTNSYYWYAAIIIFVISIVHHARYLYYEKRLSNS